MSFSNLQKEGCFISNLNFGQIQNHFFDQFLNLLVISPSIIFKSNLFQIFFDF